VIVGDPFAICFIYFKSLTLVNLAASLYALRQQDFSQVQEVIVLDNNTLDTWENIHGAIDEQAFPVPVRLLSYKHGDESKTHAWSSNAVIREVSTPWLLFTRADYILDFNLVSKMAVARAENPPGWDGFIVPNGYHLAEDVFSCEGTTWRRDGAGVLRGQAGVEYDYGVVDSGVWMGRRDSWERVGGLDEALVAWGHAQTCFQFKLYEAGVMFHHVPEVLTYHPRHEAERDLELAHQQVKDLGFDMRQMWARYPGTRPY